MNNQIVAACIAEGSKIFGMWFRNRPIKVKLQIPEPEARSAPEAPSVPVLQVPILEAPLKLEPDLLLQPPEQQIESTEVLTGEKVESKASSIASGCVPCAIGHVGTCTGVLNEAVRFSKGEEGITSDEVLERVGMCLDELNTMERIDLRPEMINDLPEWEKELAEKVLVTSRSARHSLEGLTTRSELEELAGNLQGLRTQVWREWKKERLKNLSEGEMKEIQQRVIAELSKEEDK